MSKKQAKTEKVKPLLDASPLPVPPPEPAASEPAPEEPPVEIPEASSLGEEPSPDLSPELAEVPVKAQEVADEPQVLDNDDEDEEDDFDPEQWELAKRLFNPGESPEGSVSGIMENGERLTLPVKTAIAVIKWMHGLPATTPDDGQRRIWSCRMNVADEARGTRDSVTLWTYPEAFEKTFLL